MTDYKMKNLKNLMKNVNKGVKIIKKIFHSELIPYKNDKADIELFYTMFDELYLNLCLQGILKNGVDVVEYQFIKHKLLGITLK